MEHIIFDIEAKCRILLILLSLSFIATSANSCKRNYQTNSNLVKQTIAPVASEEFKNLDILSEINMTDTCKGRIEYIRKTISNYIHIGNEEIYSDNFLNAISSSAKPPRSCVFPDIKSDFIQLYRLGDSVLLEKCEFDDRAMRLIIDIYLMYSNSPEIAQFYGFEVIPKAASMNIVSFIKILANKSEQEIGKCIEVLQLIDDKAKIDQINEQMKMLENDYEELTDRINKAIMKDN